MENGNTAGLKHRSALHAWMAEIRFSTGFNPSSTLETGCGFLTTKYTKYTKKNFPVSHSHAKRGNDG